MLARVMSASVCGQCELKRDRSEKFLILNKIIHFYFISFLNVSQLLSYKVSLSL